MYIGTAVGHRIQIIRAINERLTQVEQALSRLVANHPDAVIFRSLPRAGTTTAAAMLAGFGEDRNRWNGHEELAARWGVTPITVQSGKHKSVHHRRACDTTFHQAWLWFAFNTIRKKNCWAGQDYRAKRRAGAEHYTALRAIADTWVKIAYRCWQTRAPYDEQFHRQRRAARRQARMSE